MDALILGAGAAGLWAAGTAAALGARVLVLEKNARVGVKILASGGGACNLTTTLSGEQAARWFGPRGARFLRTALRLLPPQAVVEAFHALGVPTETEPALEKVWPVSRRAHDVAQALLRRAQAAGAVVRTEMPAGGLEREGGAFLVPTPHGVARAPRVLVATGGRSYPRTGTTGDAYAWLSALSHRLTPLAPALVPLLVEAAWVRALSGIALEVEARVVGDGERTLFTRRRPLLFTHLGLSGPAAMDVSRWFALPSPGAPPRLVLDFAPDLSEEAVRERLAGATPEQARSPAWRALPPTLPERLRRSLCEAIGVEAERALSTLASAQRRALAGAVKRCEVPVVGTRGYDYAEVTAGGVDLDEVDPGTMASRLVPGLYLAGEVLDLDGPIGGFNFQSAFATGELAGRALARPSP